MLRKHGHLNVCSHSLALNAIEKRAQRYHNKTKDQNDIDNELTWAAAGEQRKLQCNMHDNNDIGINTGNSECEAVQAILAKRPDLLEAVWIIPGKKGEGITRLFYENQDGLTTNMSEMSKLEKVKEILDDMEVDCYCFNERKLNLLHKDLRRRGLSVMFN